MAVPITLLAVASVVIVSAFVGVAAQQRDGSVPTVAWHQSQSVSVRLGIKGHEFSGDSVSADCFVEGPLQRGVRSTRPLQIARDKEQHLYFPEDFHRLPLAGEYHWGCTVGDRLVAQGRFEYIDAHQVRVVP
jgi:hypothetical protein